MAASTRFITALLITLQLGVLSLLSPAYAQDPLSTSAASPIPSTSPTEFPYTLQELESGGYFVEKTLGDAPPPAPNYCQPGVEKAIEGTIIRQVLNDQLEVARTEPAPGAKVEVWARDPSGIVREKLGEVIADASANYRFETGGRGNGYQIQAEKQYGTVLEKGFTIIGPFLGTKTGVNVFISRIGSVGSPGVLLPESKPLFVQTSLWSKMKQGLVSWFSPQQKAIAQINDCYEVTVEVRDYDTGQLINNVSVSRGDFPQISRVCQAKETKNTTATFEAVQKIDNLCFSYQAPTGYEPLDYTITGAQALRLGWSTDMLHVKLGASRQVTITFIVTNPDERKKVTIYSRLGDLENREKVVHGVPISIYRCASTDIPEYRECTKDTAWEKVKDTSTEVNEKLKIDIYKFKVPQTVTLTNQFYPENNGEFTVSETPIVKKINQNTSLWFILRPIYRSIIIGVLTEQGKGIKTDPDPSNVTIRFASGKVLTKKTTAPNGTIYIENKEITSADDGEYSITVTPPPGDYEPNSKTQKGMMPGERIHEFYFREGCLEKEIDNIWVVFCGKEAKEMMSDASYADELALFASEVNYVRNKEGIPAPQAVCYVEIQDKPLWAELGGSATYDRFAGPGYMNQCFKQNKLGRIAIKTSRVKEFASADQLVALGAVTTLRHELGHALDHVRGQKAFGDYVYASQKQSKKYPLINFPKTYDLLVGDPDRVKMDKIWSISQASQGVWVPDNRWRQNNQEGFAERYESYRSYDTRFQEILNYYRTTFGPASVQSSENHEKNFQAIRQGNY